MSNKFVEIGDGLKGIEIAGYLRVEDEPNERQRVTLVYDPEHPEVALRISVITIERQREAPPKSMAEDVTERAAAKGLAALAAQDKRYYVEIEENVEDGVTNHFHYAGFGNQFVILTLSVERGFENTRAERSFLESMPAWIGTLREVQPEGINFFAPYDDELEQLAACQQRIAREVRSRMRTPSSEQMISIDEIGSAIELGVLRDTDEEHWLDLGLAFGENLRAAVPELRWSIVRDEWGRDWGLRFGESSLVVHPRTVLIKRIERGEEIDVLHLRDEIVRTIREQAR